MNVNELMEKLKTVKAKDTEILFRDKEGNSFSIAGTFYGLKTGEVIAYPQLGEEPNCVVVQLTK